MPSEFHSIPLPCRFPFFSQILHKYLHGSQICPNWLILLQSISNDSNYLCTSKIRISCDELVSAINISHYDRVYNLLFLPSWIWASFVSSRSQSHKLQNFTWRPQSEDLHVLHWVDKNFMRLFSTGEERMFRSIKASKTWCTIQAFLVFFYKWTQKHHWSIRAQSLNLSLGTLVLPDVNF